MTTDLQQHIQDTPICDTHEHLRKESDWVANGPTDVLIDLFTNYVPADLITAGASPDSMKRLMDPSDEDLGSRFEGIRHAWEAIQFTGYGEAVRILGEELYELRDWSASELEGAQIKLMKWRQPGERLRLLSEVANLDHTQTDDACWPCLPDSSGPDFFFYDISWASFCRGEIDSAALHQETGITVKDLASLREAMETIFDTYSGCAIAVKAQHAYSRTLNWTKRSDAEAGFVLDAALRGEQLSPETRNILGDWCWSRGAELAAKHNLPFKIHTGYYAGNNRMPVTFIQGGNLCGLLQEHIDCHFVLMHIAYPYCDELVALTKHYRNVYADLCWAWSIDPYSSSDFVRRFLHAAPINKLFGFGGDTHNPTSATAYAIQSRRWLTRTLQAEISENMMSESQAIDVATRLLRQNQLDCFDVDGKRKSCRSQKSPAVQEKQTSVMRN